MIEKSTDKNTVCAVVVTFNRKHYLIDCLTSLRSQTRPPQGIIVVDNASNDGTTNRLIEEGYIKNEPPENLTTLWEENTNIVSINGETIRFHYIRLPENTGGAGGFYYGTKKAYELKYKWIWLMDDDVVAEKRALEKLSGLFDKPRVFALASTVKNEKKEIFINHRGFLYRNRLFPSLQTPLPPEEYKKEAIPIEFASFVGLMLKRDAISRVGFPNPDFFIYNDDVEYSLRLNELGKIILVTGSILIDRNAKREVNSIQKKLFFLKLKRVPMKNYWRTYYSLRNTIYIGKRYSKNKILFYLRLFFHFVKSIRSFLLILLLDDYKKDRLKIRFFPYFHGLRENLGKILEFKDGKCNWK